MEGELIVLARRLFWWKQPEAALADRDRFLAQVARGSPQVDQVARVDARLKAR